MLRFGQIIAIVLGLSVAAPVLMPHLCTVAEARKSKRKTKPVRAVVFKPARPTRPSRPTIATAAVIAPVGAGAKPAEPVAPFVAPVLTISTDKPRYKSGDLITIGVVADGRCDLTLIGIDSEDFATVLFPNDFDPDNQLNNGALISFPKLDAPYQLRVKAVGTEMLLGICSEPGHRPLGISADYERNRFTQIGDWSEFSVNKDAREKELQQLSADAIALARSKRRKLPASPLPVSSIQSEGRTMVLVPVE